MRIGDAIVIARSARGWTQVKLAKAVKMNQSTISEIETGAREDPRRTTIYKIAKALKIPAELLSDPLVSESDLLSAVKGPGRPRPTSSSPKIQILRPTRSLPVILPEDLRNIPLKDGAKALSKRSLPALTSDPKAFYLLAGGTELTWDSRCPDGAELQLEPSTPPESEDLVVVRSPVGLALRQYIENGSHREFKILTPNQTTVAWTSNPDWARVARIAVDPRLLLK